MTEGMIAAVLLYVMFSCIYLGVTGVTKTYHYFDPITNYYDHWTRLNVLGTLVFTLLLNIVLAPWAIIYWVIKFFVFIFTVGRR